MEKGLNCQRLGKQRQVLKGLFQRCYRQARCVMRIQQLQGESLSESQTKTSKSGPTENPPSERGPTLSEVRFYTALAFVHQGPWRVDPMLPLGQVPSVSGVT